MADPRRAMERRILRERQRDLARRIGIIADNRSRPRGKRPMLVEVIRLASVPTAAGKYFACQVIDPGGDEVTGGAGTFTVEGGIVYVLVVGARPPVAGDYLIAYSIDGRWVAESGGQGGGGGCSGLICVYGRSVCPLDTDISTHTKFAITADVTKDGVPYGTVSPDPSHPTPCFAIPEAGTYVITPQLDTLEGPQTLVVTDPCVSLEVDFTIPATTPDSYAVTLTVGGCNAGGNIAKDVQVSIPEAGYSATLASCFLEVIPLPGPGTYTATAQRADGRYIPGSVTFSVDDCTPGVTVEIDLLPADWAVCVPALGDAPMSRQMTIDDPNNSVSGAVMTYDGATGWYGSAAGTIPACDLGDVHCPSSAATITYYLPNDGSLIVFISWTTDPVTGCPPGSSPAEWDSSVFTLDPFELVTNYLWCPNNVAPAGEHPVTVREVLP